MRPNRHALVVDFLLPLLLILLLSLLISLGDFDRSLAALFYQAPASWPHKDDWLWTQLYGWGMAPGLTLAVAGLLTLILGVGIQKLRRYWRPAIFVLLLALLGPGLLVHAVGKDLWGRPRPVDTRDFGGSRNYHQVYQPAGRDMGKSFPSGHAAIGFYTIAPFFLLRRRRPHMARWFLAAGTGYGALMSVGRMAQGGHYLTDVLWSAYLVYFCGMFLYYLLDPERHT